ncbi:peroxygenase [Selaginella moellendorffii]|uniref:peroxygenase n=1 Tax=Selaginella moellendorffii TaxID=88036 RepID=UPI000D1D05CD|nr:peroxygenase [Selaginella moellendorffii]|eukprot:XP_024518194.1 peroxygenase [Selaginella moellendorffii]
MKQSKLESDGATAMNQSKLEYDGATVTNQSKLKSDGDTAMNQKGKTPLELHVEFFDRDGDGKVYPWETYNGFRALGFDIPFSVFSTLALNVALSYPTLESWIPDLLFPVHIKNIHKGIHGSDTGIYDHDGNFDEANFEKTFAKFARTHPDKMTFDEILTMTRRNRDVNDFFGWAAAQLEWRPAYEIMRDQDGFASKEDIRAIYDGSLFYQVEQRVKGAKEVS